MAGRSKKRRKQTISQVESSESETAPSESEGAPTSVEPSQRTQASTTVVVDDSNDEAQTNPTIAIADTLPNLAFQSATPTASLPNLATPKIHKGRPPMIFGLTLFNQAKILPSPFDCEKLKAARVLHSAIQQSLMLGQLEAGAFYLISPVETTHSRNIGSIAKIQALLKPARQEGEEDDLLASFTKRRGGQTKKGIQRLAISEEGLKFRHPSIGGR
ncbi:hypothetical protein H4Q26_011575 [Puccinia striiformis f. sp. tritici PST-130]|nr:hypothetical protein H4Q26_011575 [Puccinia striiformis f. sp. tritici PST-130]